MRTVAIIQARIGSTRLPGKVMAEIGGRPMLAHVVERAGRIVGVEDVVVAVPDLPEDDVLADAAGSFGVRVVRGSAMDVLDRYLRAAEASAADRVVRITADCPLLSPGVSGSVVAAQAAASADYASNTLDRTYPRGLDTEVVTIDALRVAWAEATAAPDREHVTPYIWQRPDRFLLHSVRDTVDRSSLRWTVDEPSDLAFARAVHAELGPSVFEMEDVLALLARRPELADLNAAVAQKPIG